MQKTHRIIRTPAGVVLIPLAVIEVITYAIDNTGALTQTIAQAGGLCCPKPTAISPSGQFPVGGSVTVSQQTGLSQTDVFAVDHTGALTVAWQPAGVPWTAPQPISPAGRFVPGAAIAASQQFNLTQTDVFVVDHTGALTVSWVSAGGPWKGPANISPQGVFLPETAVAACRHATLNRTDVFAVDHSGTLAVFWVTGPGAWNGPSQIGPVGFAQPGSQICATAQPAQQQTTVCVSARNGAQNLFSAILGGPWTGPVAA